MQNIWRDLTVFPSGCWFCFQDEIIMSTRPLDAIKSSCVITRVKKHLIVWTYHIETLDRFCLTVSCLRYGLKLHRNMQLEASANTFSWSGLHPRGRLYHHLQPPGNRPQGSRGAGDPHPPGGAASPPPPPLPINPHSPPTQNPPPPFIRPPCLQPPLTQPSNSKIQSHLTSCSRSGMQGEVGWGQGGCVKLGGLHHTWDPRWRMKWARLLA